MAKYLKYIVFIIALMQLTNCKELYDPSIKAVQSGFLIVDGFIVSGQGETIIYLSRSTGLHDSVDIIYERKAIVQVEGEDNSIYALNEKIDGQYTADSLKLNTGIMYRLNIKTTDGNTYVSDFVPVLTTPPIDSISDKQEVNAENDNLSDLNIFVSTHDPNNNTRYYLWNYEETWKFHSAVKSFVKDSNNVIFYISQSDQDKLYYCWKSNKSKSILIGNSNKLSQDVISMKPLTSIKGNSLKKSLVYSINVKQYALTQKAYEFYEMMQKNTELTGSLFDPQPSEINGNIKNINNPLERVIGYVSISTLSSKRQYLDKHFLYVYPKYCEMKNHNLDVYSIKFPDENYPVNFIKNLSGDVIGYQIAPSECVNCERQGGSNVKPVFWPDSL